jgi:hypothetical protein
MPSGSIDPLEVALEGLGYAASEGLVRDGVESTPTARSFVWRALHEKGGVDAAYFRGGVPLVAFARAEDRRGVARIHQRLWNLSRVPILIASTESEVSAYSCFVMPSGASDADEALLRTATTSDPIPEVLAEFSRFHVESGSVASTYSKQFKRSSRVDRRLLENLRSLRGSLTADNNERRRALDGFIGRAIFTRYFEDRGILSSGHLLELSPFGSFLECLRAGMTPTYALFESLSDRFNGDVFGMSPTDRDLLTDDDLSEIASFFGGAEVASGQQSFWPYDFSVIPPELIGSIYEQLLEENQKSDAAYYTPRPIVDLILDEVVPWTDAARALRLLDPACGSGIFLTEAYRRLVFRAAVSSEVPLTFDDLSTLLTESIYGIDQNPAAVGVAALGLYLGLLEELDPPTAWRDARLPQLVGSNLVVSDFFSDHSLTGDSFDVIVGNPPWKSQLTDLAAEYLRFANLRVPDRQIAMAFAFRALEFLSDRGILGMLLPAKPLLHNKSNPAVDARLSLFERSTVESIIDISILRRETFHSAVAPAAVLVARGGPPTPEEGREILHVVPRGSPLQASVDGFVVSQDDVHRVPAKLAASSSDIWKVLLWGKIQDYELVSRLRSAHKSVGEIAEKRGWIHGRGLQVEGGDANDASELLGMAFIPTEAVLPFATVEENHSHVTDQVMHRPRDQRLFRAPHVLIRRGLLGGRPVAAVVPYDAAFPDGVIGVAGSESDSEYLRLLSGYINSSLGYYYQFMTSGSWGVERDYIEANEHLGLPFAEVRHAEARRVLNAIAGAERSGFTAHWRQQLDDAVFQAYELSSEEIGRVRDTLEIGLSQFERRSASVAFRSPTAEMFSSYVENLSANLESSLSSVRLRAWISDETSYYAVATVRFAALDDSSAHLDSPPSLSMVESLIDTAEATAGQWPSPATILQPSMMLFRGSDVHLIKPSEQRYWTATNAHDDAAEVIGSVGRSV